MAPGSFCPDVWSIPLPVPYPTREACTMNTIRARSLAIGAVCAAILAITPKLSAAQGGTVTGTIPGANGTPLQEAPIIVTGTSLSALTGADGKYTVRGVPAGTAEIRVLRVGYQS